MAKANNKVQFEIRCTTQFRQKFTDLAYLAGFIKKVKSEEVDEYGFQIDAAKLAQQERFYLLEKKQGVSEMIMSIVRDGALIINGADKSDTKDLATKFNRTNANMSQLRDLTEGQSFTAKGEQYNLQKLFEDFLKVRIELSKDIDKIMEGKTLHEITDGPAYEAKKAFALDFDIDRLNDRMTFVTDEETERTLRSTHLKLKPMLRQLVGNAKLFKRGAPINHPDILEALAIYQRLNKDVETAHILNLENKSYTVDLYRGLRKRHYEAVTLVKKIRGIK